VPEKEIPIEDVPENLAMAAYIGLKEKKEKNGEEIYLFRCWSEGGYAYTAIADIAHKNFYSYSKTA